MLGKRSRLSTKESQKHAECIDVQYIINVYIYTHILHIYIYIYIYVIYKYILVYISIYTYVIYIKYIYISI